MRTNININSTNSQTGSGMFRFCDWGCQGRLPGVHQNMIKQPLWGFFHLGIRKKKYLASGMNLHAQSLANQHTLCTVNCATLCHSLSTSTTFHQQCYPNFHSNNISGRSERSQIAGDSRPRSTRPLQSLSDRSFRHFQRGGRLLAAAADRSCLGLDREPPEKLEQTQLHFWSKKRSWR